MANPNPTGVRPPGVTQKRRRVMEAMMRREYPGFDPLRELIGLAMETEEEQIKLGALKEVANYVYPKLKSVEHTGQATTGPLIINVVPHASQLPTTNAGQTLEHTPAPAQIGTLAD